MATLNATDLVAAQRGRPIAAAPEVAEATAPMLDGGQRQQVVDTLIAVLGGAYAHLPAKRAAYALDPVQELTLLRRRVTELSDAEFHLAVSGVVTRLRDAHTRYIGPVALRGHVAALPFLVEQYGPYDDPQFVVTKTSPDVVGDGSFQPGVRLEWWNGIPFARAVELHADRETGGRPDARRARALESLTFRALDYGPPPDEQWVIIGYRSKRGTAKELRLPWRLLEPGRADTSAQPGSRAQLKQATNPAAEAVRRAKKLLFAPHLWAAESAPPAAAVPAQRAGTDTRRAVGTDLPTSFQDNLAARALTRDLGYLRIWSFDVGDDNAFLDEVTRLLRLLPQKGLVVDLRANPGGLVWAAERMLQLFTDHRIAPTRFQLVASPLTREMAASPFNRMELEPWAESLDDAVSTGEQYAQPLPLTDPEWCNDRGRVYPGAAVAVVDPNTYSSGDLFAAGWVDNEVGPLVCVGEATGAGGANVWTGEQLRDALTGTPHQFAVPPAGVGFTLAIRRAIRSGRSDGVPIEDLGITGIPYAMTRDDLLHSNKDLYAFCATVLAEQT
ncbi:MAG: S41 family peptidase [Angustibacter sp.]